MVVPLERLPGFRNVIIHEYVALDELEPVERFLEIVRRISQEEAG